MNSATENYLADITSKGGLPANFEDIVSKETILRPLPIDALMEIAEESLKEECPTSLAPIDFEDFYSSALYNLHHFSRKKLKFWDRTYYINSYSEFDGEEMIIEIEACKQNMKSAICIHKEFWTRDDCANEDPNAYDVGEYFVFKQPTAGFLLKKLYSFFTRANESINNWNKMCCFNLPLVNIRPPYEAIEEEFKDAFFEDVVPVEYIPEDNAKELKELGYKNAREHFKDYLFNLGYWMMAGANRIYEIFGEKPVYNIGFSYFNDSDGGTLVECYIAIERVKAKIRVFCREFHGIESFCVEEVENIIYEMIQEINENIVQWNKMLVRSN